MPKSCSVFSPGWADSKHCRPLQTSPRAVCLQHSHKRPGSSFTHPVYFIFSRENSEFEAREKHLEKKAPAPSLGNVAQGRQPVRRREHREIQSLLARGKGCKSPSVLPPHSQPARLCRQKATAADRYRQRALKHRLVMCPVCRSCSWQGTVMCPQGHLEGLSG